MSKVRVVFLGTPEFAVTCLKSILEDEHFEVVGVVTQPDRPAGRKLQLTPSPVRTLATARGLRVIAPESLKANPLILEEIKKWRAEVAVVVAFGQILTEEFLKSFPFGAVNVHASVLPRWRGAAPIQRAIEAGDKETGVALQRMVKKLDAGDVLGIKRIAITDSMNAQELHDELAKLGCELLKVELMDYVRGNLVPTPQDESLVTYAKKIEKSESQLDLTKSAQEIHNKVRAFSMGPGCYVVHAGKKLKIHRTEVLENEGQGPAGKVKKAEDQGLVLQVGVGTLLITEVQPESKSRMSVEAFLKGHSVQVGEIFGS